MLDIIIFIVFVFIFGILSGILYFKFKKSEKPNNKQSASIILIILTLILLSVNIFISSIMAHGSVAFIISQVFLFPLIVVALLSLSKESRNWNSRIKTVFFTSIIIFLSLFGNLLSHVQQNQKDLDVNTSVANKSLK